ncbi:MAG: SPOR domain-containing protein [Pseudomonadota bacterium]
MSGFEAKSISKFCLRGIGFAALLAIAASCTRHSHWVEEDFAGAADFSSLTCAQLDVAEIATLQRMAAISPIIDQAAARDRRAVLLGPVGWAITASEVDPPEMQEYGVLKAERLLITGERGRKNCEALRLAALQQTTSSSSTIALETAQTAATPSGTFLQVGTFADPENATRVVKAFQAEGLPVDVRPIEIAGNLYRRVVIGPVGQNANLDRAIAVAAAQGLNDAFMVKS